MVFNHEKYQAPRNPPSIPYGKGFSRNRQGFYHATPKPVYKRPTCTTDRQFQPWRPRQEDPRQPSQRSHEVARNEKGDETEPRELFTSKNKNWKQSPKRPLMKEDRSVERIASRSSSVASLHGNHTCSECRLAVATVNGLKRHLLSRHARIWCRSGVTRPASVQELQQRDSVKEKDRQTHDVRRKINLDPQKISKSVTAPSDQSANDPTIRKRTQPPPAFGTTKSKRPCIELPSTPLASPLRTPNPLLDFSPCSVDLPIESSPLNINNDDTPSIRAPLQTLNIQFNTGVTKMDSQSTTITSLPSQPVILSATESNGTTSVDMSFQSSPLVSRKRQLLITSLGLDMSPTPCKDEKKRNVINSLSKISKITSLVDSIIIDGKSTFPGQVPVQPAPPPSMLLTQKNKARISREKIAASIILNKENKYDGVFSTTTTVLGELGALEITKRPPKKDESKKSTVSVVKIANRKRSTPTATTAPPLFSADNATISVVKNPKKKSVNATEASKIVPDKTSIVPIVSTAPLLHTTVHNSEKTTPIFLNVISPVKILSAISSQREISSADLVIPASTVESVNILPPAVIPPMSPSAPVALRKSAQSTKDVSTIETEDALKSKVDLEIRSDMPTELVPVDCIYTNFITDTDVEHFLLTQEQPWIVEAVMKDAILAFPLHHTMDILLRISLYASSCRRSAVYLMGQSIKEVSNGAPSFIRIPAGLAHDFTRINLFVSAELVHRLDTINFHPRRPAELNRQKWSEAYHWATYMVSQLPSPPYNTADIAELAEDGVSLSVASDRVMAFTSSVHAHRMVAETFLSEANDRFPPDVHTTPLSVSLAHSITLSHAYGKPK